MSARFHVEHVTAQPLLDRLDGVQKCGTGWRARCPSCGGRSRKLSITETDSKVLVTCFGCHDTPAVLAAVGLTFADLFPPRSWPETPQERRQQRRAAREAGWAAALSVLALEANVLLAAAEFYAPLRLLTDQDQERLSQAVQRIHSAANELTEARRLHVAT